MTRSKLEEATITAAHAYAMANGYDVSDKRAAGLVLAGMGLMASSGSLVAGAFPHGYLGQMPEARPHFERFAAVFADAVELDHQVET